MFWGGGHGNERYFSRRGTTVFRNCVTDASHVIKATPTGAGVSVSSVRLSTVRAAWRSFSKPTMSLDPGERSRAAGMKPILYVRVSFSFSVVLFP